MSTRTLTIQLGAPGGGFSASFSLVTGEGTANWHGSPEPGWAPWERTIHRELVLEPLDPAQLARFRAKADEMREQGAYIYRDQFAQAGVSFVLVEGESTTKWEYHLDGGMPRGDDDVYTDAAERVWAACDAQAAAEGPLLPEIADEASLMTLHRETAPWLPATLDVARKHRLKSERWVRASDGSQIVMIGDDAVIKFYVPFWPSIVDTEQAAMDLLKYEVEGFEIPRVRARGALDGWEYLAVSRVAGTPLREVVDDLTDDEALNIARSLGAAIRTLHDVKVPKDSILRDVVPKWRAFLSDHRARRRELEIKRGTSPQWADRLVAHLKSWRYRKRPTDVFLHADLTYDHIMLEQVDGAWTFSGLIDFGDVKIGDPAYDFAAPFVFWTADRPDLRRAMLDAYGAGEELLDRIFESMLLHEFGRLAVLDLDGLGSIDDVRRRYIDLNR